MATQATQKNTFMVAAIAGLAGAAAGVLFAPKSGRETRQQLRNNAKQLKQKANSGVDSAKQSVGNNLQKAKDSTHHFTSAIKHTGKEAKDRYEELQDKS